MLGEVLKCNNVLYSVNIGANGIGLDGWNTLQGDPFFLNACVGKERSVYGPLASSCLISFLAGIVSIAQGLSMNQSLSVLDISANNMGGEVGHQPFFLPCSSP